MIGEPIYQKELENRAKQIVKNYAVGRLIVAGDNRYLSGDLLDLLSFLLETVPKKKRNKLITRSPKRSGLLPAPSMRPARPISTGTPARCCAIPISPGTRNCNSLFMTPTGRKRNSGMTTSAT